MKEERAISWLRIIPLAAFLIGLIAVSAIGKGGRKEPIGLVPDTAGIIEDSLARGDTQPQIIVPDRVAEYTVPSETVPRHEAEDTIHAAAAHPLENALKKRLPVVADFGRSTCIPCKMMLPILEKLKHDLEGKASVIVIDIRECSSLSQKFQITLIPTQIFFDSTGEEVFRHQGFMSEEDIITQLKKMGVD